MDLVVADDGTFEARDWVGEFDPQIVEHVIAQRLVTGRALVAADDLDSPSDDVVRLAARLGFETRVLASLVIHGPA